MFKQKKLLQKQSQGLLMIRDGMNVQIEHLEFLVENLTKDGKPEVAKECKARLKTLYYWRNEMNKALFGELHF